MGRLVLDAVERSVDPLTGEIQVFKFLNCLYHSARDYERLSTENMIHIALQAVEEHSLTLEKLEDDTKQRLQEEAASGEAKGEKEKSERKAPPHQSPEYGHSAVLNDPFGIDV